MPGGATAADGLVTSVAGTGLQRHTGKLLHEGYIVSRPCGAGLDSGRGPALVVYLVPPASDADTIAAAVLEGAR